MDGTELVDRVQRGKRTELDRLGSQKALIAITAADLTTETVLSTVAATEGAVADVFAAWAETEDGERASEAFAAVAERERACYERIAGHLDSAPDPDGDALCAYLRDLDGPVERAAAGLVARPLVRSGTLLQVINFFINEADEPRANVFRDLRTETEDVLDEGVALLDELCAGGADWERAQDATEGAIQVAYDEYAQTLEAMGVDPKPVC